MFVDIVESEGFFFFKFHRSKATRMQQNLTLRRWMRMREEWKVKETFSCIVTLIIPVTFFFIVLTTEHFGSDVNPRLSNQCGQVCGLMRRLTQGAGCAHGTEPWQRSWANNNKVSWIGKGRQVKGQGLIQWPCCSSHSGELCFSELF